MTKLRPKHPARQVLKICVFGLAGSLALSGCVSSAISGLSLDSTSQPDSRLAVRKTKANGQTVPELQFAEQTVAKTSRATATANTESEAKDPVKDTQQQIAMNAVNTSIYATQPPSQSESQSALQAGVTVPVYVPVPSFSAVSASIYSSNAAQPGKQDSPKTRSVTTTAKAARVGTDSSPTQVAGLYSANPPVPSKSFDKNRFAQVQMTENPVLPSKNGRAPAKLNSFFPPKPDVSNSDYEDEEGDDSAPAGLMRLISAPGLARVAPNGIWIQTPYVETDCFKPDLIKMLHKVEHHFGKPPIVTSGYRSQQYNRRAGGVRHSLHTTCDAADIQVNGVSKWQLASYLRSLPGRGGVGTYCYTNSVHIDTGSERDWNWRCRRKKRKKKH